MSEDTAQEPDWQLSRAIWPTLEQRTVILGLMDELKQQLHDESGLADAIRQEAPRIISEVEAAAILVKHGSFRSDPVNGLLLKPLMHLTAHHAPPAMKRTAGDLIRALLDLN